MMYQQQSLLQQPGYNSYTPQLYQYQNPQPQQVQQEVNYWRAPAVDGIEDAYRVPLPPNTLSVIAYDIKRPMMYLITVDGLNRTVTPYDYVIHQEPNKNEPQSQQSPVDNKESVTLESINNRLTQIEEALNGSQSNSTTAQSEPKPNNSKYKSGNGSNAGSH